MRDARRARVARLSRRTARKVVFAALQNGTGDIFVVDLQTREITNLTKDDFADSAPTWSPDGQSIVYVARVSGNEKLFRLDIATGQKTQLTFGTHDDAAAQFLDAEHAGLLRRRPPIPSQPIDPDVARNGKIYNIWTLNLKNGELRQYTDAVGGNLYARRPARTATAPPRIGVISYYKGEYELHALERRDPIVTAASSDFGAPGPIIDFQAPLSHTLVADKKQEEGQVREDVHRRPPAGERRRDERRRHLRRHRRCTFSDVLGDQQFSLYAASISQYRTLSFSYLNLAHRFNYALQGYSQTQFFYGNARRRLLRPVLLRRHRSRSCRLPRAPSAAARRSASGRSTATGASRCPAASCSTPRSSTIRPCRTYSEQYQEDQLRSAAAPIRAPRPARRDLRAGDDRLPRVRSAGRQHDARWHTRSRRKSAARSRGRPTDVDARYYQRLGATGLLALRARGFKSWGDAPDFMYFGGNSEMRGYEYLQFVGDTTAFFNAELRFPLIEAMLTPLGVLGGIRGVFFANMGGGHFEGQPFKWWTNSSEALHADHRLRQSRASPQDADLRRTGRGRRLPPGRRARVVRRRPRDLRARLPDSLRLVVEDALQQGLGGRAVRGRSAAATSSARRSSRSGSGTTSKR